jgi:hypothetical protein
VQESGLRRVVVVGIATVVGLLARPAAAQYYAYPYLEAECPDTATGSYVTKQTSVTGFSGTGYLRSAGNTTPASYNNTSADHALFQFPIRHFAYYEVWFRVNTNNSAGDDSFFFQIAPAFNPDWVTINGVGGSGWQWVSGGTFPLGVGTNTLEIANREDGLNIDKIAILPYGQGAPSGTGQQAYNCPVPMYFETECRGGAFAGYQRNKVAKTGFSGTGYIEAAATNLNAEPRADEATYFFETGATAYNFFFRVNTNASANNDSWFYSVDGASWVTMNGSSSLGTGWRWAQGAASITLSHGRHNLRIRNRESGLSLDKIAFVPTSATGPSGTGAGSAAVNCEPFQTMSDWKPGEVNEFYNTHYAYINEMGADMILEHIAWHDYNGNGGQFGTGSGIAFLGFHRAMMNDFNRYALETNGRSFLPINTLGPAIPNLDFGHLNDAYQALMAVDRLDLYSAREDSVVMDFGIPGFLTISGVGNGDNGVLTHPVYTKLGDIDNLDDLGRALGDWYHISFHTAVGGTMSVAGPSVADPIFFGWHGLLDRIVSNWLTTTKGKAWAAANTGHRFLQDGFTDMEDWDYTDWD